MTGVAPRRFSSQQMTKFVKDRRVEHGLSLEPEKDQGKLRA